MGGNLHAGWGAGAEVGHGGVRERDDGRAEVPGLILCGTFGQGRGVTVGVDEAAVGD